MNKLALPKLQSNVGEGGVRIRPIPFSPPPDAKITHFYQVPVQLEDIRIPYSVYILERRGHGMYFVKEPDLDVRILDEISSVLGRLASYGIPKTGSLQDPLHTVIELFPKLDGDLRGAVAYYVAREISGYGLLDPVLKDPEVEDISCEGLGKPVKVWHRRFNEFEWLESNISFQSPYELDALVAKMAFRSGRPLSTSTPLLDATLPEGHRVSASWQSEVSPHGSSFTIRKFRERPYTITELIGLGTVSSELAAYLWSVMEMKGFTIIAGITASGKTTLLNAITTLLNPNYKLVSIEDVREIQLPHSGWKPLVTRPLSLDSPYAIDIELLTRFALRERPDYIILGEGRGVEVRTLFQSAATGHGVTTTFHAPNPEGLVARLVSPPISLDKSILRMINCVAFISKVREGTKLQRRVTLVGDFKNGDWSEAYAWDGRWWRRDEYTHVRLAHMQGLDGTSVKQMEEMMDLKIRFLDDLLSRKVYSYTELAQELRKFYASLLDKGGFSYPRL